MKINPFTRNLLIAFGVTLVFLFIGIYNLTTISNSVDQSFDNGNATHVCNVSAEVLSTQNTGLGDIAGMTNFMSNAKKSWVKYNCLSVLLTDDSGHTCYGSIGFRFDGFRQDDSGIFTCSDIPKNLGSSIK